MSEHVPFVPFVPVVPMTLPRVPMTLTSVPPSSVFTIVPVVLLDRPPEPGEQICVPDMDAATLKCALGFTLEYGAVFPKRIPLDGSQKRVEESLPSPAALGRARYGRRVRSESNKMGRRRRRVIAVLVIDESSGVCDCECMIKIRLRWLCTRTRSALIEQNVNCLVHVCTYGASMCLFIFCSF